MRFQILKDLLSVLFTSKSRERNHVLFYAFSVDKLAKDENGDYFNFIVDGWICDNIVQSYFYAEKSINGEFRQPSAVPKNFNLDRLKNAGLAYAQIFNDRKKYDGISREIAQLLGKVFREQQLIDALDLNSIKNIFSLFEAEYRVSKIFLKKKLPALIISSEQPGSAFLAATVHLAIPSLDLQHGLIDKFHPQYTYSRSMLPLKRKMVIPNWVGVFGEFHKKILIANGFWSDKEIVVLGSKRVDLNRMKYKEPINGNISTTLLLPTQWTVFEEMKTVVQALTPHLKNGAKIILKLHPLENAAHIAGYKDLARIVQER
jgi:hypothetical protein